jgi:ethanolamine utilization protein EutA
MEINSIELLSVGIDVGSSTSHLVFSNLLLSREERSVSHRFRIEKRDIVYEGRIIDTPLADDDTIDLNRLTGFVQEECGRAGIKPSRIQTGAVIVTGETAKKNNARLIADVLSNDAGKFVAATAGPNFESLLAAMGSGATARSKETGKTILSCDIGGGTSNIAVSVNGEVVSTSCISVGGRLLSIDPAGRILRLSEPARKVMKDIGLGYKTGDRITGEDIEKIAASLASALMEVLTGPAESPLAKALMVTENLNFRGTVDEYSFSGGVAEFIYGAKGDYGDIGKILADKIKDLIPGLKAPVVEPANKIRATVIGAGSYSLSISGSSGFMDDKVSFPIRNLPVLRVDVERSMLSVEHVVSRVKDAFRRFDLTEGEDMVALYFRDPVRVSYPKLEIFAKSIEAALHGSIERKLPVILIFEKDIACSVGNVIRRETRLKTNLLSLDELTLKDGDWIDISPPLVGCQVFPVTVKSLVFNMRAMNNI